MKASHTVPSLDTRKLVAVIRANGELVLETSTPINKDQGYPCVILGAHNTIGLTTGDLTYWLGQPGSVPVYEGGDRIELQF